MGAAFYGKDAAVTQGVQRRTKKIKKMRQTVQAEQPEPRRAGADDRPTATWEENGEDRSNGEQRSNTAQAAVGSTIEDMRAMLQDLRSERERLQSLGRQAIASGASTKTLLSGASDLD